MRNVQRLTSAGFGSSGTTAFGSGANTGTTGGGLFGGGGGGGFGSNTTGTSAFGGSGGFGSKPAFGTPATTTAGTGMFGGGATTASTGGGGFGSGGFGSTNTTSTPFGGSTSLFGGAKPATTGFGTGTSTFGSGTGSGLFGGGATTGTTGFGATTNPGIGTNVGDPPGTAVVAFSPTVEKEAANPSQSNSFQNLLFMDAYKKWSSDELRLADYNQGRKTGGTGGTGAFGSSGFGTGGFGTNTTGTGFGATTGTGGMFGSTQPAAGGFGATNTAATTGGFGSGGGLFGNKPATGGLFGGAATTQPAQTGGLFGGGTGGFGSTNTATTGGFGSTAANTGGGLFGGANTAAAKPAGFSFGTTATGTGTGTGAFGSTTATPGFGANTAATNTGGGLFGNTAQTNTTGGGLFGGQQQQPATTGFGGGGFGAQTQNTGGGLFGGQQQQKPGGLFGGSTTTTGTTGGLFGGASTGTTPGFGTAATAQPATGGLFGNKPAGTGTGLFGASTTTQQPAAGGGLFGNLGGTAQTQQPAQGGLFGGLGQNAQAKPSLFGGSTTTGGGLFGNQPAQQQTGGLFGASTNQQPQTGLLGNSLLGASQGQQQPQQAFNASLQDISAYGASTLFSGLPDDKIQNPGPLATPLSGKSKVKSRSILPMYKLSPANASRFATPQKRGYGFSYSAYGSPASPSSVSSTPGGFGQSLLAGSVNRGLSKSISASNLRRSFNVEDSILQPGAFSANSSMRLLGSAGNHKKLIINKEMRSDLFTSPHKEKQALEDANGSRKLAKRVSFDTSTVETTPDSRPAALENGPSPDDVAYPQLSGRSSSSNGVNVSKSSPAAATPEIEQAKGKELAIVHEEESPAAVRTEKKPGSAIEPGAYWMSPTAEDIRAMNRMQRQKVHDFTVGRENVGSVTFKVPVDLSNINLDELFDGIIVLVPRSATVYPVAAKKPPVGKGLNVPAIISLEHSYPRGGVATTGRRLERHIERLKTSIPDTTFESYDKETGVWTFSVEHFTTYGLGDDEEDDDDVTEVESLPARQPISSPSVVKDSTSPVDPDDTFEFKRSRRAVPGAFDDAAMSDNEEVSDAAQRQGTLSPEPQEADAPLPSREWPEDESMADGPDEYQLEAFEQSSQQGSVDGQDELQLSRYADDNEAQVPAGIMRARMRAFKKSTAPTRIEVAGGDDWTQILQASVRAPRTVDRATLRTLNETGAAWDAKDRGSPAPQRNAPVPEGPGFATSIDLMKSLFEQAKGPNQPVQASPAKGFVKVGVPLAS